MTTIEFKTKLSTKVKRFCFFASLEEMILFEEIVIFVPADNLLCFKSISSCKSFIKIPISPIGNVKFVLISKLPFIVPPDFCKYFSSNLVEVVWFVELKYIPLNHKNH